MRVDCIDVVLRRVAVTDARWVIKKGAQTCLMKPSLFHDPMGRRRRRRYISV